MPGCLTPCPTPQGLQASSAQNPELSWDRWGLPVPDQEEPKVDTSSRLSPPPRTLQLCTDHPRHKPHRTSPPMTRRVPPLYCCLTGAVAFQGPPHEDLLCGCRLWGVSHLPLSHPTGPSAWAHCSAATPRGCWLHPLQWLPSEDSWDRHSQLESSPADHTRASERPVGGESTPRAGVLAQLPQDVQPGPCRGSTLL